MSNQQHRDPVGSDRNTAGSHSQETVSDQASVAGFLRAGLAHHQAGRLAEAEAHYRQVLAAIPDHGDALHLLGAIAYQRGRHEMALDLIRQAIQQNGGDASYHTSCGLALQCLKRLDEAVAAHNQALALKPDFAEALINRGLAFEELGRFPEALESYDRALAVRPNYPEALNNRGNALQQLGRLAEALESYDQTIALMPGMAEAYRNRGDVLKALGRPEDAANSYRQAVALYHSRGEASRAVKQLDKAVASYDRALARRMRAA